MEHPTWSPRVRGGRHRARAASVAGLLLGSALAAAALPGIPLASAATAREFGCDIEAQKPGVRHGEVIGHAAIACDWGMAGRTVRVEVWQKAGDGSWRPLSESVTDWLGMDRSNIEFPIESAGFWCTKSGGNDRTYQTRVFIGNGSEPEAMVVSTSQKLGRDCLKASAAFDPHQQDNDPPESAP